MLAIIFFIYCYLNYFPTLRSDLLQSNKKPFFCQPKSMEESNSRNDDSHQATNHGFKQKKPDWVREKLIELKAHFPKKGCRKIAAYFNQQFEITRKMTVSKTYVATILRDHAYEIYVLRREMKNKPPIPYAPKTYYGLDLTYVTDTEGKRNTIFGLIDFQSRACLALNTIKNKSTLVILKHIILACEKFGTPKIIRTDNEPCFTSKWFTLTLWLLGIKHQTTELHAPWQNGKIERLFGTLKEKVRQLPKIKSERLPSYLTSFRFWYNFCRPHQNLNGKMPAEVWSEKSQRLTDKKQVYYVEEWNGVLKGIFVPPD